MRKRFLSTVLALSAVLLLGTRPVNAQEPGEPFQNRDEATLVYAEGEDLSDRIIQAGGFYRDVLTDEEDEPEVLGNTAAEENLKAALYRALVNFETSVDLSQYSVHYTRLATLYTEVLNEHPELFYATSHTGRYSYYGGSGILTKTELIYEYSAEEAAAVRATADTILAGITSEMNAEQKLLYLHDYLVTHCEYDLTYSKYNIYNALVEQSAVCQGYATAYVYLGTRAGLDVKLVTSNQMNHAWNLVTLNSTEYFVDCTFDDPSNHWYEAYCSHANFLRSRNGMISTDHYGTDWVAGGRAVYSAAVNSTAYDSCYWSDVITAIPQIGSIQAFTKKNDQSHYYLRLADGTITYRAFPQTLTWRVWQQNGSWVGNYASVSKVNNNFYVTTPTQIYRLGTDGELELIYTLSTQEQATGYLYGAISEPGGYLAYNIGTQAYNTSFTRKRLAVDVPTGVNAIFTDVKNDKWYATAVKYVYDKQIMKGMGQSAEDTARQVFKPNDSITRAEFVTVLYNKEQKPQVAYTTRFKDVVSGKWYTDSVLWAAQVGITSGYPNGKFGVSDKITREQIAKMLYDYANMKGYDVTKDLSVLNRFADKDSIKGWAQEAMAWAVTQGIMSGSADASPKLNPKSNATRAECASMVKKLFEKYE